jgi:hypothetical protein
MTFCGADDDDDDGAKKEENLFGQPALIITARQPSI